jgi:drug/metabolite transporter (DMT)-like permease
VAVRPALAPVSVKAIRSILAPIDGLLFLMVFIWASNYTIVKIALRDIPPLGFNSLRLLTASALFLVALSVERAPRGQPVGSAGPGAGRRLFQSTRTLVARDWAAIAALGIVGHFIYQLCFLGALARTTVSNSALILGCSPVMVTMLSGALGHERVSRLHGAGALLSLTGIYLLAGRTAELSRETGVGDLLCLCAVVCWAVYTVASRPLLKRLSPLVVTGYSMAIGTVLYVPFGLQELRRLDWFGVGPSTWGALVFSAVFALFVAYLIWYTAVQRIGNLRTSIYSNGLPLLSMAIAAIWLGERIAGAQMIGAAAILCGVALTRFGAADLAAAPPEE